jgi:hypothetical protein
MLSATIAVTAAILLLVIDSGSQGAGEHYKTAQSAEDGQLPKSGSKL